MTGLRMTLIAALLAIPFGGCKAPCKNGTLRTYVQYEGRRPQRIRLILQQEGTSTIKEYNGTPKKEVDSLDIDFAGAYPLGTTFLVTAEGFGVDGELIARDSGRVILGPECTPFTMRLDSSRTPDGGLPDAEFDLTLPPFVLSHIPDHYQNDGTCSLPLSGGTHSFDTTTGLLDGAQVPTGCLFQNENVTSSFGQDFLIGVLAVRDFTLASGTTLQVTGNSPLAIVAGNDIRIDGVLDGSADHDRAGPGGFVNTSRSPGVGGSGATDPSGADSGGAGGSFGIRGADASDGTTGSTPAVGGRRGSIYNDSLLSRGLEAGSAGGHGSALGPASPRCGYGGGGGGAIQLSAAGALQVGSTGRLYVNGGGGLGGCVDNTPTAGSAHGGGGGGSGGALFLESPNIIIGDGAVLTANGGGGGSGASEATTTPPAPAQRGNDGQNGQPSATIAQGGAAVGTRGGSGGTGAASNLTPTGSAPSSANSGGGGAGYGRIVLRARIMPTSNFTSSPAANTQSF